MQRVSTKIVLDTRQKLKKGNYSVKLRIAHKYQQKYYSLNAYHSKEEWEEINNPKCRGNNKRLKLYYESIEKKAIDSIQSLHPFSIEAFERSFFKRTSKSSNLINGLENYYNKLKKEEREGTASTYSTTISSVKKFLQEKTKPIPKYEGVTIDWLKYYEDWMSSEKKSVTTIGINMRNIRTILNIAIDNNQLNREAYPFGKRKYVIPASRNVKKALKKEDIQKIFNYIPKHEAEEEARDLWIFSYLCNGMNIKDIALLKQKNIIKDKIPFHRAKTINTQKQDHHPIIAYLNEPMRKIIHKWGKRSLNQEEYIFNILSLTDTPEDIFRKVKNETRVINNYMRKIGKRLEIDQKITTYSARHSFATILKNSNTPTEFISEALGHTSLQTTANYLDSFEKEEIIKNQEKLINF